MKTILVWVLVIYIDGYNAGGPAIVDNLASRQECERLGVRAVQIGDEGDSRFTCTQVRKVVAHD